MARTLRTDAEKTAFLRAQFALQQAHYRTHYRDADFCIIKAEGRPIGRFYVHRGAQEFRLVELSLLPAWRGHGIGGVLVQTLVQEATAPSLPVTLHVEPSNPARRFYLQAGFRHAEELGFYERLVWLPPDPAGERDKAAEPGQQQQDGGRLRS